MLESIWLRDWTAELMPKIVRLQLGIDKPKEEETEEKEETKKETKKT